MSNDHTDEAGSAETWLENLQGAVDDISWVSDELRALSRAFDATGNKYMTDLLFSLDEGLCGAEQKIQRGISMEAQRNPLMNTWKCCTDCSPMRGRGWICHQEIQPQSKRLKLPSQHWKWYQSWRPSLSRWALN